MTVFFVAEDAHPVSLVLPITAPHVTYPQARIVMVDHTDANLPGAFLLYVPDGDGAGQLVRTTKWQEVRRARSSRHRNVIVMEDGEEWQYAKVNGCACNSLLRHVIPQVDLERMLG